MKIRFGYEIFLAMAVSIIGVVAAWAQSGVVGAQVLPTADLSSARGASVTAEDNGARPGDSHVRICD